MVIVRLPYSVLFVLTAVVLITASGCEGTPDPKSMDAEQKAKLVTKLEKQAEQSFGDYVKTQGDLNGVDVDALLAYLNCHREIVRVMGPGEYPNGYGNYGVALSRVGYYYQALVVAFESELAKAPPGEAAEIKNKIRKYKAEATAHFRASNNQFRIYLDSQPGSVNPLAYQAAVGNCVELEEWQGAKDYLQLLMASGALNERALADAKGQLKLFEERRRRQDEAALERELDRGRDRTPPEPAN